MSNIYREQQRALTHLKRILEAIPRDGINRKAIVMEMLTVFAVSENILQKYIDTHIEMGAVVEHDGILTTPKKAKA